MWPYRSCILLIISSFLSKTSLANTDLNVGVVEFKPAESMEIPTAEGRMSSNVAKYIEILNNATNLDLIIYPEATLNVHIPLSEYHNYTTIVNVNDNPCTDNDGKYPEYIKNISCAVRAKGKTYVVINTEEKEKCPDADNNDNNCKLFGARFYNTDIIFDTEGTICARYRKYNLFGEIENNTPATVDHTTFKIKNETIGVFTCFDILFKTPPEDLLNGGIKTIAYPTMWFSEIPFLTALQTQQMWSIEHNVNIFSANANNPGRGSGGSGIFYGKSGPINYDIISQGGTKLLTNLVDDLPTNIDNITTEEIDALGQQMDNFTLLVDQFKDYTSVLLNTSQESGEYNVCHSLNTTSFCCSFNIKISKTKEIIGKQYVYHLVAYSGIRSFSGVRNGGIDVCGLIACRDTNLSSCGYRLPNYSEIAWPITFEQIEISSNFTDNKNRTQYPNTLLSSIRPLHPQHFEWIKSIYNTDNGRIIGRTLKLTQAQNRLFTFAIYGRNFELDSPSSNNSNNSNMLQSSYLPMYITYLIAVVCFIAM